MNKEPNHFVVRAKGCVPVDVYFAQSAPLTSCVARAILRNGKEEQHVVIARGESFYNPKDEWNSELGKQKAFGKMKSDRSWFLCPLVMDGVFVAIPAIKDFERAFYEWMKGQEAKE
jgi:hypothetical protein